MKEKETFYFSHDYNTREDEKIKDLIFQCGMVGYGIYWAIVEMLYQNANALRTNYPRIAHDLHQSHDTTIKSVIEDFGLFEFSEDGNYFFSNSIKRRLEKRDEKSRKARESANSRWNKSETDANALRSKSKRNAIKESKVKEIKVNNILLEKESKEENLIKEFPEELFTESEPDNPTEEKRKKVAQKKEKFKIPSLQEVQDYCNERQNGISAYSFVNFYQSKGWRVGNQPMKDWKAAIRTWEQKNKENGKSVNNTTNFGSAKGTTSVSNTASGKTSATTAIARHLAEITSGNSQSGDITTDAEIV